jgi:hypothetical protein
MFVLNLLPNNLVATQWNALQPKNVQGTFKQTSKDYH